MVRPGNTIQINVSIPKELVVTLKERAEREKRSLSNLVAYMLTEPTCEKCRATLVCPLCSPTRIIKKEGER